MNKNLITYNPNDHITDIRSDLRLLHGGLVLMSALFGFWNLQQLQSSDYWIFSILLNLTLFFSGIALFVLKSKKTILVSCVFLFLTIYSNSFFVTDYYYFSVGAFILYIDLIMIMLIYYGGKVGFLSMVLILLAQIGWNIAIQQDWISPAVHEPNIKLISYINASLTGYFIVVISRVRHLSIKNISELKGLKAELEARNEDQKQNNLQLKEQLKQISAVHNQHTTRIESYIFDIKYCINSDFKFEHLKDQLHFLMAMIDAEIKKINVLFKHKTQSEAYPINAQETTEVKNLKSAHQTVYTMSFMYIVSILLLDFKELGFFNVLIIVDAVLALYGLFKMKENDSYMNIFLVANLFFLFTASFLFRDLYLVSPTVDSIMVFFSICFVYTVGVRITWPILLLFTLAPVIKYHLFDIFDIQSPIEITYTDFKLFANVLPLMIGVFFITLHFYKEANARFSEQMKAVSNLKAIMQKVNQQNLRIHRMINDIQSLADFNVHHLRAPIARSNAIMDLLSDLEGSEAEFEDATGHNFFELIDASINELESHFKTFDDKLREIKTL